MSRTVLVAVAMCLCVAGCSTGAASPPASSPALSTSASTSTSTSSVPSSPTASPRPTTFPEAFALVQSGVVRLDQTDCDGNGSSGSGFLLAPDLVATVAHVVHGAHSLSVRVGREVTHGTIVALDTTKDLALVRVKDPISGHVQEWGALPTVGSEVAVVGYPEGEPLTVTRGHVNALGARIEMEATSLSHLIKYDAATNGGNSGGPVIGADGRVLGLVDAGRTGAQGESFAIPTDDAQALMTEWMSSGATVPLADCPDPWSGLVTVTSLHADAPAMALTFSSYFEGINSGDYSSSFDQLTGAARGQYGDLQGFESELDGVTISHVVIEKAKLSTNTADWVTVSYRSHTGAPGTSTSSCKKWHVRYVVRNDSGWWAIDTAEQLPGSPARC